MKFKFLFSLLLGSALTMSAQGYKDGIEYYKADQFENAKTILNRTIDDASTDKSEAYYYLGEIALRQGDKATAESNFQKGIAANPQNGFNYVGLGALALLNGDEKSADDYFKQGRNYGKKNPELVVAIARAYYNADPVKYTEDINKNIERALKIDKKAASVFIFQGDMKAAEKEIGDAAGLYENAILYDENNPEAYVKYANAYASVNLDYAIEKLQALLAVQPNSALAQRELAEKYYLNNQWSKAAVAYGDYMNNPNHFTEDAVRYSVLLYYGQRYEQSLKLAEELLAEDPQNFQLQRIVFLNKIALKDYVGAEKQAESFFALNDSKNQYNANDYSSLGEVLRKLDKDSLAIIQYEKAAEVSPKNAEVLKQLSSAYYAMAKYEQAAQAYQRIIDNGDYKANDEYVLAGRYMSYASEETDSLKKVEGFNNAVKYIDSVLAKVDTDYRIHQRKGRIMMLKNNNTPCQESTDSYNTVLALLDADPANKTKRVQDYKEAYDQIAGFYLVTGDVAKAKEYYLKHLEIEPENEALRNYIDSLKVEDSKTE